MKKRVFFGIDPGVRGYMTAFDGKEFKFYSMPVHKVEAEGTLKSGKPKMKTVYNERGLKDLISEIGNDYKDCELHFMIEEVTGRNGWAANKTFNFGFVAGQQRMIPIILGANYITKRPAAWQSFMRQGYDNIKKPSSTGLTQVNDPKAVAEMIVKKEYPNIDFRHTKRSTTNDDNKIDSFLMCLYLYRTMNKKHENV